MPFKKDYFINFLISIIPFTYIAGNLILNANILLIIIFSIFFYKAEIFYNKFSNIDKLILIFFIYIALNGVLNDYLYYKEANVVLVKSLSYSRFLILYFIFKFLAQREIINYKFIFFSFGAASLFVVIDLLIQFTFGKDIFGFPSDPFNRRLSGPFGDEPVAGSFVQRFYIFALYAIFIFHKFKNINILKNLIFVLIGLFSIGILLAGNRISLIMFALSLILFFLFEKEFRRQSIIIFIISFIIFAIPISLNKNIYNHYAGFLTKSFEVTDYLFKRLNYLNSSKVESLPNSYAKDIETGILVWSQKKIFGGGIKSFYLNCSKIENSIMNKYGGTNCNTHPHNYYLHIASELGLFGLFLFISILSLILFKSLKILIYQKANTVKMILTPFLINLLVEIFPLKTTGSFFTSSNATFLFIIIAIIVGLFQIKERQNYGK